MPDYVATCQLADAGEDAAQSYPDNDGNDVKLRVFDHRVTFTGIGSRLICRGAWISLSHVLHRGAPMAQRYPVRRYLEYLGRHR